MAKHLLVVLSNCHEGTDEEFNKWYTGTHIPDIINLDGFVAARRYRLADRKITDEDGEEMEAPYQYLALYEVDGDKLDTAADSLTAGVDAGMEISDSLDRDGTVAFWFSAVTERMEAGTPAASGAASS